MVKRYASENLDILRIVKEDMLEKIGKKNNEVIISELEPERKVSKSFISKAISELEEENLIRIEGEKILLTKRGQEIAMSVAYKHSFLEEYLSKSRDEDEAWKAASLLEHYISEEVINNLKKISTFKRKGKPLTETDQGNGLITDVTSSFRLFERMISMGITPGERIKINRSNNDNIIFELGNKKFSIDKEIAKYVKIVRE